MQQISSLSWPPLYNHGHSVFPNDKAKDRAYFCAEISYFVWFSETNWANSMERGQMDGQVD